MERKNTCDPKWVCGLFAVFPGTERDTSTFAIVTFSLFHGASSTIWSSALLRCGRVFGPHYYIWKTFVWAGTRVGSLPNMGGLGGYFRGPQGS